MQTELSLHKGVCLLRKLQTVLPCTSFFTIYKLFIRPLVDYADMIYDHPSNAPFSKRSESVQYNAALAIGAIKGCFCEKVLS